MPASYQKLPLDLNTKLHMDFWVKEDYFGFHWHYHPEIEICYVRQGFGQRIVGESTERFAAGDLVLVGSNLPHCWISDHIFNDSPDQMEVYVIHLDPHRMGHLLRLREFSELKKFLEQATSGFAFSPESHPDLHLSLQKFEHAQGFKKTLSLLELLDLMMASPHKKQLCRQTYLPEIGKHVEARIQRVCQHIHARYKEKISIAELAQIAIMNESAFCRFFKKAIGKTAIEYINELRINTASHELVISRKSINQIAMDNGFLSLSQFNQLFKRHNERTPSAYRKEFGR